MSMSGRRAFSILSILYRISFNLVKTEIVSCQTSPSLRQNSSAIVSRGFDRSEDEYITFISHHDKTQLNLLRCLEDNNLLYFSVLGTIGRLLWCHDFTITAEYSLYVWDNTQLTTLIIYHSSNDPAPVN